MSQAALTTPTGIPKRSSGASSAGDSVFALVATAAGIFVLVLLGTIIISLFIGGLPALRHYGLGFLTNTAWDPRTETYGAAVPVFGTIVTSFFALLLAVPLAFGIAYYLTELAPNWLRQPVGTAIELLAAVPSIIYGMWGFFVIVPVMGNTIEPFISETLGLGNLPGGIGDFFNEGPGTGLVTAAIVLAVMIIPFIAATMRDVFLTVPPVYKESAYGVGCTTWEVMRSIVIPYTRISVVGGIMLGLGRALGETMAVTFVIGNSNRIATALFDGGNTIASIVALEFPEAAPGSYRLTSLLALGFLLFVLSFIVLFISRLLLKPKVAH